MGVRILLVEDESRVASFIARGLREQTYAVDVAADGEQGVYLASINPYDVVVLDVMLPVKDGYAVCRELRAGGFRQPILMLTARDAVDDRVAGLDAGADDYLTKPFDFNALLILFCVFCYHLLARALAARVEEKLASQATTAGSLLEDELRELNGDVEKAAAEVVTDMRLNGSAVAVLRGGKLVAGTMLPRA